jgi:hypothetical protein
MRIEVGEPQLVSSLLGFLRGHVHLNAEQIGPREIEVSQLGSMNWDARRLELDLMLQVWRTSHAHAAATILD